MGLHNHLIMNRYIKMPVTKRAIAEMVVKGVMNMNSELERDVTYEFISMLKSLSNYEFVKQMRVATGLKIDQGLNNHFHICYLLN
jgi:hypothetical protein